MIERLVEVLQALASPLDIQRARAAHLAGKPRELERDFSDALMLVLDCPQVYLTPDQTEALLRVEAALEAKSGAPGAEIQVDADRRGRMKRSMVRRLAAEALAAIQRPVIRAPSSSSE